MYMQYTIHVFFYSKSCVGTASGARNHQLCVLTTTQVDVSFSSKLSTSMCMTSQSSNAQDSDNGNARTSAVEAASIEQSAPRKPVIFYNRLCVCTYLSERASHMILLLLLHVHVVL